MIALQPVGENLWLLEGPVISVYGLPFTTRMAVARLRDGGGGLWLWSPVELGDEVRAQIAGLGEPRHAVEPNKLHHLALPEWVEAWPSLQLHAPPGLARKRADLRFAAELGDEAPPAWRGEIDQVLVEGSAMTEVLFFHRPSSTILVGDLVQKHDGASMKWWNRWVMSAFGVVGPNGSTPREWRLTFRDRDRARGAIERALSWSPRRLVIAHGACAMEDGAAVLRRSLAWLLRK